MKMHLTPPSGIKVVKKEDKEVQLQAFIDSDLSARESSGNDQPRTYLVVARSMESPVVRAMFALAPKLASAGVSVRIVLSAIDLPDGDAPARIHDQEAAATNARLACDARLFDAHEQLVLGGNRVWIGDVMRREPSKRDAYETYSDSCRTTANWAITAFDRLWAASTPISAVQFTEDMVLPAADSDELATLTAATGDIRGDATVGTRH